MWIGKKKFVIRLVKMCFDKLNGEIWWNIILYLFCEDLCFMDVINSWLNEIFYKVFDMLI